MSQDGWLCTAKDRYAHPQEREERGEEEKDLSASASLLE